MMELTTYTELEIAHRLMTAYAQKCTSCHGHRYEVEITVTAKNLNADGMIVDFKKLKEVVKTVLDDKWDHGSCFNTSDPLWEAVLKAGSERVHIIDENPTLEWMVEHWALDLQAALDIECPGVAVSILKASETARNTVTWRCNCLPWERTEPVDDMQKPMCSKKVEDLNGAEEECYVPEEDTILYLVQFRTDRMTYRTTVRTALKGNALVDRCYEAARAFVTDEPEENIVLLGISKLPG